MVTLTAILELLELLLLVQASSAALKKESTGLTVQEWLQGVRLREKEMEDCSLVGRFEFGLRATRTLAEAVALPQNK